MKNLRVAIVGLGKMGLLHASILNSIPNVEIVGLCDRSYLLLKLVKKLFKNAQAVNTVEKLVDLDINTVYVTTPIPSHFSIIKTVLSKRIAHNIFVEKTLTSNYTKSKELCALMQTTEGTNMVGYMKRFAVTFAKAKEILLKGDLGKVVSFEAYAYSSDFSTVSLDSLKSTSRGGVLSDLGSHVIDLALWFFGDFEVESSSLISNLGGTSEDSADFIVKKSGLTGQFQISWCKENFRMPNFGLSIKGKDGILKVNDSSLKLELNDDRSFVWLKHDLDDHVNFMLGQPEFYRENEAFVNSVFSGIMNQPSFRTASQVDYIIDQAKKRGIKNVT